MRYAKGRRRRPSRDDREYRTVSRASARVALVSGHCKHCGAFTSKFGLSLGAGVVAVGNGYRAAEPGECWCVECEARHGWNWFPYDQRVIFGMVDRVPWVPTEREAGFWRYWNIDHWFARRK